METKYQVNDIVYRVQDYRVIKSIIDEIIIKKDNKGINLIYVISSYKEKNNPKKKAHQCIEAELVDNITTAKESALTNWERITKLVKQDLNNLTDRAFEPDENK